MSQDELDSTDAAAKVPPLRPRIDIAMRHPTPETQERVMHRDRGMHLARQEAWDRLSHEIRAAEAKRELTSGGTPVAALLSRGARHDAVKAARDAILVGDIAGGFDALIALHDDLREGCPGDHAVKHVVAAAYLDLAQICAGGQSLGKLSPNLRKTHDRALETAYQLVDRFDPFANDSPLWAAVRCGVLPADPAPEQRVADDYEDVIELDPGCPGHLRAMGRDLLPARFGSYGLLDQQARRVVGQTSDVWGTGAYSIVMAGATEMDPGVLNHIDSDLFAEGVYEILTRFPSPHYANIFAAFTGLIVPSTGIDTPVTRQIIGCFDWIIADYLTELHPILWAEARRPGTAPRRDGDPIRRGRNRAEQAISQRIGSFLHEGESIVFTASGMRISKD
ncbi:hypothetical protein [Allosediminivita pacifica]|nr:hypothetical protein [Allosediminivita pacifica]